MIYSKKYISPLGNIRLFSNGKALTELRTEFWRAYPFDGRDYLDGSDLLCIQKAVKWLDIYFSGHNPDFLPPLAPVGSPFRQEVWNILLTIPYGKLMTYGEIAAIIAQKHGKEKMSAQAVGGAVGANPIGIIIPCHRVIGANGNLTGYAGGLLSKVNLLKSEGINTEELIMPKKSKFL